MAVLVIVGSSVWQEGQVGNPTTAEATAGDVGPTGTYAELKAEPPMKPGWRYVNVVRSYAPGTRACDREKNDDVTDVPFQQLVVRTDR